MRKLFTGFLFAIALPASASVTSDIEAGELSTSDIITNAVTACGGNADCQASVIEEAIAAGIDVTSVINLAIASGVDSNIAANAAIDAGQDPIVVGNAIAAANGLGGNLEPTASGGNTGGLNTAPNNNGQTAPGLTTTTIVETGENLITIPEEQPTGPTPPPSISPAS